MNIAVVSDALELKVGDIQRELELGNIPLAIRFLPKKDRETIKEGITFLASDGVELLRQYLDWRKKKNEIITEESPLFVGLIKRRIGPITSLRFNDNKKSCKENRNPYSRPLTIIPNKNRMFIRPFNAKFF